jgi:hypothetical protein
LYSLGFNLYFVSIFLINKLNVLTMKNLREILRDLEKHQITLGEAEKLLKIDYLENLEDLAQLDVFRKMRTGIPEVIFAASKSTAMVLDITKALLDKNQYALLTKLQPEHLIALRQAYPNTADAEVVAMFSDQGRVAHIAHSAYVQPTVSGKVGIITAGTSDIPIAKEAQLVLEAMGISTMTTYDVGISGMHRIFPPLKSMIEAQVDVFIVIAGMEGTLPGIVSALVDKPVIGVPTSTGYGLGEKGMGALGTMLQSCSPGLAVVNIDNGFGAATMAALIVSAIYTPTEKRK